MKFPWGSVVDPSVVLFIKTFAKGSGSRVVASITRPAIEPVCAIRRELNITNSTHNKYDLRPRSVSNLIIGEIMSNGGGDQYPYLEGSQGEKSADGWSIASASAKCISRKARKESASQRKRKEL